jgi:hypothetical protein
MVANKEKGHFEIKIGEQTFTAILNFDAMIVIEEAANVPINEVFQRLTQPNPPLRMVRAFLFGSLREAHPEVTERMCGDLIFEGGIPAIVEAFNRAGAAAFPDQVEGEGGDHPTKAAVGTGAT